ncbi:hypothetical protein GCM10027053_29150 [Intrasporangium mesophilum]
MVVGSGSGQGVDGGVEDGGAFGVQAEPVLGVGGGGPDPGQGPAEPHRGVGGVELGGGFERGAGVRGEPAQLAHGQHVAGVGHGGGDVAKVLGVRDPGQVVVEPQDRRGLAGGDLSGGDPGGEPGPQRPTPCPDPSADPVAIGDPVDSVDSVDSVGHAGGFGDVGGDVAGGEGVGGGDRGGDPGQRGRGGRFQVGGHGAQPVGRGEPVRGGQTAGVGLGGQPHGQGVSQGPEPLGLAQGLADVGLGQRPGRVVQRLLHRGQQRVQCPGQTICLTSLGRLGGLGGLTVLDAVDGLEGVGVIEPWRWGTAAGRGQGWRVALGIGAGVHVSRIEATTDNRTQTASQLGKLRQDPTTVVDDRSCL